MDRRLPSTVLPHNPALRRLSFKLTLGVFLLIFLSGYQPSFHFPPLKKSIVHAEEPEQTKTIQAQSVSLTFQAPHPGYISTHFSSYHPGIDLATGLGMPVKPITKGKVISAGYNFFGLGLVVEVEHPEGYRSLYAHMGATYVKPGQEVDVNNQLGEVGLTGNTSGPHTHLEVYKDGKAIDPLTLLPAQRNQPEPSDFIAAGGKIDPIRHQIKPQPQIIPDSTSTPKTPPPSPEPLKDFGISMKPIAPPCSITLTGNCK